MELCPQKIVHEAPVILIPSIHSLVLEDQVCDHSQFGRPLAASGHHAPSSHRRLTANEPGAVVLRPCGCCWPSAAARLSKGFAVAISASRATASVALCSRSCRAFSSARSRLIFSSSRSSSSVSSSSSSSSLYPY